MRRLALGAATALAVLAVAVPAMATAQGAPRKAASAAKVDPARHQFGIIGHSFHADESAGGGEARLKQALADESEAALAFVVVTGIKGVNEPCSDRLYARRRELLDDARRPVIVLPSSTDWSECKNSAGRSVAIDRLNRLRELFFGEPLSLGVRKLPVTRLSSSAKFRSYAENAHWQVGDVLYATVNLPANNNHFRPEAGRNSEFEDRLVANRFWLNRLFAMAKREKLQAVVLFSEGDVKALAQRTGLRALLDRASSKADGFDVPRRQIATLAAKYEGKVLLVDTDLAAPKAVPAIEWRGNLGHLSLGAQAVEVTVAPGTARLFTLQGAADEK
ncbi:hypothetical protein [Massilia sp. DWR3-1-1]|uniref:hypothetical protein n=1 Tax=Massilia sp. DWR3-1-1 TaxID=2804559 RepID=UPI003CFB9605